MPKQVLRSLSLSYQKGLGWHQPSQAFFWHDTDYCDQPAANCCLHGLYFIVDVIPKMEGLAGLVPVALPFGMTATKILRHVLA